MKRSILDGIRRPRETRFGGGFIAAAAATSLLVTIPFNLSIVLRHVFNCKLLETLLELWADLEEVSISLCLSLQNHK